MSDSQHSCQITAKESGESELLAVITSEKFNPPLNKWQCSKRKIKNLEEWNEHLSQVLHHILPLYVHPERLKMPQTFVILQSSEPIPLFSDSLLSWSDRNIIVHET